MQSGTMPSFVSPGLSFLTKPRFTICDNLEMVFKWEIKCAHELPAISLKIAKITTGLGCHSIDVTEKFIFSDKLELPETSAPLKRTVAHLITEWTLAIKDHQETPTGQFRLLIEMKIWDDVKTISQNFVLVRNHV